MARNRELPVYRHSAGPPDVSGEEFVGHNATLRFDGQTLTGQFKQGLKQFEVIIPAAGLASVVLGNQQRNKRFPVRLFVYDGDVYIVEVDEKNVRSFLRLSYALTAAGVKVTEEPPQPQGSSGASVGFFVGF